ncbi:MAG: phasin, PhaP [Hasllibacter sp.]
MNNTNEMQKMFADMLGAFPVDTSAMKDAWKTQSALAEKLSRVALDAAETSTEISAGWTKRTIGKMNDVAAVKDEPADYGKAMTDFASATAEMTAETMAQFAEVAKKVQMETVELMLAAGRETAAEATAAAKPAAKKAAVVK